nr:chromosome (plasmid) partitioning protein ParA [uncultured bacterium]
MTHTKPRVTADDLASMKAHAKQVVAYNRAVAAAPSAEKVAPSFTAVQLASMAGISRSTLENRRKKGDLPDGHEAENRRRLFTLPEAQAWVRAYRKDQLRPVDAQCAVITTGNFKGGVGKSTTAATLAQGLSLRGHRVLVIDTDPQGSITSLMGVAPETLSDEQTVLSISTGDEVSLAGAIQKTYWSDIDLVGAAPRISAAQFHLPARTIKDGDDFWSVLAKGLTAEIRANYDVVVIDTPPALDYLTINAFYAADILVVPLPPSAMDFVSSTQFWDLFVELNQSFSEYGLIKDYSFVNVLLSRVDSNDAAAGLVREWISEAYGKYLLPVEIPTTAAAKTAAAEFGTVYDSTIAQQSARTYRRALDAYERLVEIIEGQLVRVWKGGK